MLWIGEAHALLQNKSAAQDLHNNADSPKLWAFSLLMELPCTLRRVICGHQVQ